MADVAVNLIRHVTGCSCDQAMADLRMELGIEKRGSVGEERI